MMRRTVAFCTFAFAVSGVIAAGESCVGIADGDVALSGSIGQRFDAVFRTHVLAEDLVCLTKCYGEPAETACWQNEFWGQYMYSAVPLWVMTRSSALKKKIDGGVANLCTFLQPDVRLGNCISVRDAKTGMWDVWGVKYTMMGLLHYYDATGDKKSLETCSKLCDYLIASAGPKGRDPIAETGYCASLSSYSVLEPVVWLYNRNPEKRFLDFATCLVKEMTDNPNGPRLLDQAVDCVPVSERSEAPAGNIWCGVETNHGKACEMMSCYQALIDYAGVTGRKDLVDAAVATAWDIADQEINLAGSGSSQGHWYQGAKHQHEAFPLTQETCVTIAWMRLCEKLLLITCEPRWADQMEKTFYNAYLGSLSPDGRHFASYTPMNGCRCEGQLHARVHTNCCNANGPSGFLSFLRSILMANGGNVFVNHYVSSRVGIEVPSLKEKAVFEVHTLYPKDDDVDIRFRGTKPMKFRLSLRVPCWAMAGATIKVNEESIDFDRTQSDAVVTRYVPIDREWLPGDVVKLKLPLAVAAHRLGSSVAFTRGPVLLARDSRFKDGELAEVIQNGDFSKLTGDFRLEQTACGDDIAMTVSANLPLGFNAQNPDGRECSTVRFCDYASAGNRWRADNPYRTWLTVTENILSVLPKNPRLDRSRFIVGAYGFAGIRNPTEADVKRLVDCGIDVISYGDVKTNVLEMFAKYGIKCFRGWTMPGDWWWFNSDPKKKFKPGDRWCGWDNDRLRAYLGKTPDHPAVVAVSAFDEPNAMDYPFIGKTVRVVKEHYPEQFPFVNLFPNYAFPDNAGKQQVLQQLGAKDYEAYVAGYCKCVPLDYICYDFYPFAWNVTSRQFYDNLRVVADACGATERSHWLYLQCARYNQDKKDRYPIIDEPRLRYQVATAMAYGAECIIWACWAPSWRGWDINAVDADGNPTAVYEPLRRVNKAIHRLSPEYMKYKRISTDLVGIDGELVESSGTAFRNVKATDGAALAVGHFAARSGNGNYAIFIAAIDDPNGRNVVDHKVTFAMPHKGFTIRAVDGDGCVDVATTADRMMSVPLRTCRGVLVLAERKGGDGK